MLYIYLRHVYVNVIYVCLKKMCYFSVPRFGLFRWILTETRKFICSLHVASAGED